MSINHLNIQNKQTGDKLSATEFNSTTSKINEVVDGVNASATGGKIGSDGTPLTKDSSGRIIIPLATSSSSGAMSASDKSKLDSINPSGGTGDYVDSISNEANYTANDMYDTTSEFYGTNHKINTRSISYTTSDGSTHTFTHLDTVYKVVTPSTTAGGTIISGKAGLMSPQDKQKLDMMPRPSDITSALSGKADKQIVVLVTRTQQGSTYVYSASKTFDEISTAIGNGTNVILQYDENYYHLSYSTRDYIVFTRFVDDYYMYSSIEVNLHDELSYSSFILQEELTIDSTPTRNSNNLVKSGGVYEGLASKLDKVEIIEVTGSGTASDPYETETQNPYTLLTEAVDAGVAAVWVKHGEEYYHLNKDDQTEYKFHFTNVTDNGSIKTFYIDDNDNITFTSVADISSKQDALVSGTNIKTVNGTTLLGSGNIDADDAIMGKIDGASFYRVTGYSGLNATPTFSDTAEVGNENKIYVDILTNRAYRWTKSIVSFGESKYKLLSEELSIVADNEINSMLPPSTKKAISAKVLRDNFYTESEVNTLLGAKQDTLVSGTNIKTVNGQSLVGSGNVAIQIPPASPEPLLVYMTESGGTYSIDQEVFDIEDALSENDELECYLVWDGNNPAVVRLRCYGYNVEETIGGHSQSCIVWSGLDNIGNRHIVKAYHDSTNDVDMVNYSVASPDGRGITSIVKTATVGLVDTYTITYSDGTTSTYTVTNGRDGQDGQDGADGVSLGEIALVQTTGDSEESVMSQKAVTEKFDTVVYESKRPSYFKGTFSKFNIADFPLFDPRDSDGISVLIEWDKRSGNRVSLFEMMTANQNNRQQFFALAFQFGNIKTGLISNYFQNVDMGCTGTTPANYNHLVITLDFKNGITKIYINGVLYNTIQASNYSYETLMTYLNTCTKIGLGGSSSNAETKTQGLAVFGHVLTDDDVTTLFGGGCEELKTELIPEKWEANNLKPHYFNCGIGTYNGQANAGKAGGTIVGDTITIKSDCVVLYLALTGIDGSELYGNCIYDFDFEVLSGTGTTYDIGMQYAGNYWKCFTMTDEDGNDVSYNTQVGVGRYHVTSRPDNILINNYNGGLNLGYIFVNCSSDFSIKLHSPVRLIERGAAIICTPKTYKGLYWQQRNGYKIPTSGYVYESSTNTIPYYDIYKSSTVKYASNVPPRFNGQMAVDSTNGKVYVGYLTSTGGTWKQINNS